MFTSAPSRRASLPSWSASSSLSLTPADHDVLEGDPLPECLGRLQHRLQIVFLLDRHDGKPLGRGRGMQRNCQPELLRAFSEFGHAGQDPYGGDGDVPGSDAEAVGTIENAKVISTAGQLSSGSPMPMKTMLVGFSVGSSRTAPAPVPRSRRAEVAAKSHPAGGAEGATQRAAGLG